MQVAGPTFEEVFRKNLKRVLNYWSQIGTVIGLSAAALGLFSLYMYTRAIGRTDLFMASIDARSALVVWLVMVLFLMLIYLLLLTVTTLLFGLANDVFRNTPEHMNDVVVWLTLPVLAGFLTLIVLSYYVHPGEALASLILVAVVVLVTALVMSRPAFKRVIHSSLEKHPAAGRGTWGGLFVTLTLCLLGTVISGIFTSLLIINAYNNEVSNDSPHLPALLNFLGLLFSLLPIVFFYCKAGSPYKRVFYALMCTLLLTAAFLLVLPGAMSQITYKAAGSLDVRQDGIERFVLHDDLELHDLDPLMWNTRQTSERRLEVQGFQLFSFGEALLICPKGLRNLALNQMHRCTRTCIRTRNSAVTRKPAKPLYGQNRACAGATPPAACWKPQGS